MSVAAKRTRASIRRLNAERLPEQAAPAAPAAAAKVEFRPAPMTPALAQQLQSEGYVLPDSWPANARVIPQFNSKSGWRVETVGGYEDQPETIYIAPDGSRFCKASNGARVVAVGLSRRVCGLPLRVAPGARRPRWVIESMPKGEIPEHLRKFLLRKGEKLTKGEQRVAQEAEQFAVEPSAIVKGGAGKLSQEDLRRFVEAHLAKDPEAKLTAIIAELREAGRSCSNDRTRAMLAECRQKAGV
jgi:hypothetical protein